MKHSESTLASIFVNNWLLESGLKTLVVCRMGRKPKQHFQIYPAECGQGLGCSKMYTCVYALGCVFMWSVLHHVLYVSPQDVYLFMCMCVIVSHATAVIREHRLMVWRVGNWGCLIRMNNLSHCVEIRKQNVKRWRGLHHCKVHLVLNSLITVTKTHTAGKFPLHRMLSYLIPSGSDTHITVPRHLLEVRPSSLHKISFENRLLHHLHILNRPPS